MVGESRTQDNVNNSRTVGAHDTGLIRAALCSFLTKVSEVERPRKVLEYWLTEEESLIILLLHCFQQLLACSYDSTEY